MYCVPSLLRGIAARLKLLCGVALCCALTLPLSEARFFDPPHTISLMHMHTKEKITITYKRDGRYDKVALDKLNWFLRDWRRDEPTKMDPRLFDLLWEVTRELGTDEYVHVVSAYRSPQTNEMLRSRSRGVAKQSQHTMGRAMDFYIPDMNLSRIRYMAAKKQLGGVGFYPSAGSPFVHLDVGSVRAWPRLTRDQLASIFPDGNTIHIPADGRPMSGYEATVERIGKDGKNGPERVAEYGEQTVRGLVPGSNGGFFGRSKNLFTALFGGGNDEDSDEEATPAVIPDKKLARNQQLAKNIEDDADEKPAAPPTAIAKSDIPIPEPRAATGAPIALPIAGAIIANAFDADGPIVPTPRPNAGAQQVAAIEAPSPINSASTVPVPTPRLVWEQGPQGIPIKTPSIGEAAPVVAAIAGKPIPRARPSAIAAAPSPAPQIARAPEPEKPQMTWNVGDQPVAKPAAPAPTKVETVNTTRTPAGRTPKGDKGNFARTTATTKPETSPQALLAAKPFGAHDSFASPSSVVDKSQVNTFR